MNQQPSLVKDDRTCLVKVGDLIERDLLLHFQRISHGAPDIVSQELQRISGLPGEETDNGLGKRENNRTPRE